MSVTPPEAPTFPLGPGELKIGATGTEIDVSCLVNNATIAAEKEEGDSTTKLCGTVRPGAVTYTYTLAGNMDTDVAEASGFFALSQSAPGTEQSFTYTPNTDAGTSATWPPRSALAMSATVRKIAGRTIASRSAVICAP